MRKIIIFLVLLMLFNINVSAATLPTVPDDAEEYMPAETDDFGDGLWYVIKTAIGKAYPDLLEGLQLCAGIIATGMLCSLVLNFPGSRKNIIDFVAALSVAGILFHSSSAMIHLGIKTVNDVNDYGKLILPVMTTALATQGGITSSSTLYVGTVFFCTLLTSLIINILVPLIYVYLVFGVANSALDNELLTKIRKFVKWLTIWSLKIILYVFTGYITITGVVSGTTDASVVKATKLTISGVVPVIGNILSDASESVIISAGVMKNAAGVYGLIAILAIWIGPFLKIGAQYLLLKITGSFSEVFGIKRLNELVADFSFAMGALVAMASAVCLMLLISIVCFMKGVGL